MMQGGAKRAGSYGRYDPAVFPYGLPACFCPCRKPAGCGRDLSGGLSPVYPEETGLPE